MLSGWRRKRLGDNAGAVASYEKAIALNQARNGKFASAHVNLSAYYNRTGDACKRLWSMLNRQSHSIPSLTGPGFRRRRPTSCKAI